MRRRQTLIFIFLILIIAAAVGFVVYSRFAVPAETPQSAFVEIYVAGRPISQGGEIKPELLSTIKIAQADLVTAMYQTEEQGLLLGKIARFPLDQGVVITASMVGDASAAIPLSGPLWTSLIPSGMTAISIPIDRLGLTGYAVNTGAHVNINACLMFVDIDPAFQTILPNRTAALTGTGFAGDTGLPVLALSVLPIAGANQGRLESDPSLKQPFYVLPSETKQRPRMVCKMLLQDVVVMRVGDFPSDPTISITAAPPAVKDPQAPPAAIAAPDIVTLIVSPQDSVTLSYLILTDVELTLTLRNPGDKTRQPTQASTLQFLLGQYDIPIPEKLSYSLEPIMIRFGNLPSGSFFQSPDEVPIPIQ